VPFFVLRTLLHYAAVTSGGIFSWGVISVRNVSLLSHGITVTISPSMSVCLCGSTVYKVNSDLSVNKKRYNKRLHVRCDVGPEEWEYQDNCFRASVTVLFTIQDGSQKRPQLCNDVVLFSNRIQTKRNNILKSNHSSTV